MLDKVLGCASHAISNPFQSSAALGWPIPATSRFFGWFLEEPGIGHTLANTRNYTYFTCMDHMLCLWHKRIADMSFRR